jgi:hypothetical protein
MRQRYIWLIIAGAVTVLVLACGGLSVAGYFVARNVASSAFPNTEATFPEDQRFELPSPAITADAAPAIVLEDDFADDGSGWYTVAEPDVRIEYADGGYQFVLDEPETGYWETHRSIRLRRLADVTIEVEARQVDGYADDTFGIVCRANEDGYYALEIGADGWYSIGKMNGDEYTLLAGPDGEPGDEPSTADTHDIALQHQDADTYRLRADCIGDTLTLYADGEKIAEVQDASFPTGGIGLTAYNYQAPRTEIVFDNIVVRTP